MTNMPMDTSTIPGWGIDADPSNDPTHPIRHIENQTRGSDWDRPAQQKPTVEVLESIEYNRLPAVIGTSTPPSWASGAIRRYAFRRSESDWWHWLLLMGADRLNVVEGVVQDLGRGKVPNIPAEMGIRSAWRHDRPGLLKKAAGFGILAIAAGAILTARKVASAPTGSPDDEPPA